MFDVSILISALIAFGPLGAAVGVLLLARRAYMGRARSPLPKGTIRVPGHRLMQEITDAQMDFAMYLFAVGISISLPLATAGVAAYINGTEPKWFLFGTIGVFASVWAIYRLVATARRIWRLTTGLDAELDTAHHLGKLAAKGYVIFHDIPAEGFNIDHLAIGPNGVFAIESKGRRKPLVSTRSAQRTHEVIFRDGALHFPTYSDRECIAQAQRQAKWCSSWLSRAVGTSIAVTPVLCIPGWYVKRAAPTPFPIVTSKSVNVISKLRTARLSPTDVRRIEYQVEQRAMTMASPLDAIGRGDGRVAVGT
jgi:hypothetical protein